MTPAKAVRKGAKKAGRPSKGRLARQAAEATASDPGENSDDREHPEGAERGAEAPDVQQSQPAGKKQAKRKPKVDPVKFWGDRSLLPEPLERIEQAEHITALVSSLGRIPIAGRQTAAEHWLKLVYERAGVLAGVLAAAGGLSPNDADDEPR